MNKLRDTCIMCGDDIKQRGGVYITAPKITDDKDILTCEKLKLCKRCDEHVIRYVQSYYTRCNECNSVIKENVIRRAGLTLCWDCGKKHFNLSDETLTRVNAEIMLLKKKYKH